MIDFYIVKIIGYLFIAAILVFAFIGGRKLFFNFFNKDKKSKDSQLKEKF